MKIYQVIQNLGIGGAQSMAFNLMLSIDKFYPHVKQQLIYQKDLQFNREFVSSYGLKCTKIKEQNKIVQLVNKEPNSVVIYHKLASCSPSLVDLIRRSNKKIVIIVVHHTLYCSSSWKSNKSMNMLIGVSKNMESKFSRWYPKATHTCIRNFVIGEKFEDIEPIKTKKEKYFITTRCNRICGWKSRTEWYKFIYNLDLPNPLMHYYIGGGIRDNNVSIPAGLGKKSKNKIQMMGKISNFKEKISIMKSADITLYETVRDEGISMALLESLACSVPIVISDNFGNKEIVEQGVNGYIFKDYKEAGKIVKDLMVNPKKLKKLKETTKEHFYDKLDARHGVKKYMDLINKLTGENIKAKKEKIVIPKEIKVEEPAIEEKKEEVIIIPEKKEIVKEDSKVEEKTNNKFSIITASYNKEKYLNDWAISILAQKYRPLEVVLVNDCSTDNTSKLLEKIEKDFTSSGIEIKIINNKEQLYCASAYKKAVSYATGSYLGILDADDMLVDDSVDYIMGLYKKHPDIAWIYTQFMWCDERMNKKRKGFHSAPKKGESLLDMGRRREHGIGTGWRTFSHKIDRFDKLFKDGMKCAVDKNMGYRLEEMGVGMFVDRICYRHRGHPVGSKDSVSSTKEAIRMWKEVVEKTIKRRKKYDKKPCKIIEYKD
jgi:glycosyltransferase involved in cell wall biosynthesis